jgi:hypothetical protein
MRATVIDGVREAILRETFFTGEIYVRMAGAVSRSYKMHTRERHHTLLFTDPFTSVFTGWDREEKREENGEKPRE